MIASAPSLRATALLLAGLLFGLGCAAPRGLPSLADPLEPMVSEATPVPGVEDLAAAHLAAAALASNAREMELALQELDRADAIRSRTPAADDSDMLPLALDLVNATLDDPDEYRSASKRLMKSQDEDQALRMRLDEAVESDPLEIASSRIYDSRMKIAARTFNAVTEPIGRSLITGGSIAPFALANSLVHWLAMLYSLDPISIQGRQALVQQERFVEHNPGTPEALEVVRRMEGPKKRLNKTHRNHLVKASKLALEKQRVRMAEVLAERALTFVPDDEKALELKAKAQAQIDVQRTLRALSLGALDAPLPELAGETSAAAVQLAHALLLPGADIATPAEALRAADPAGPLADEAEFALAIVEFEKGWESISWGRLTALAYRNTRESNMARHATGLLANPWQDTYGAFRRVSGTQRNRLITWKLLGPWSERPRYDSMPPLLAYLIDAPTVAQTLVTSPLRLAMSTVKGDRDFKRPSSVLAYRYLERYPEGEHRQELIDWLYDYERKLDNYSAALRLADYIDDFDPEERLELVEHAATQQLNTANRARRRDLRGSVLRNVTREYPDSQAGHMAGAQVREEFEKASAQRIRMTREFLKENPQIAGPRGLGLRAELNDGDLSDGELHPMGITFLGGRTIEMAFVAESGDEEDEPLTVRRMVSAERLARVVALLEETVLHNSQVDPDDRMGADARRDYYFERARLGLTDKPDTRATAESTYVYRGMRERYGMVRAREGVLPFDLVVQGNLSDFSIGAFPRLREPKETPDAFLYR